MSAWEDTQKVYENWVLDKGIPTAYERNLPSGRLATTRLINFGTDDDVPLVEKNISKKALFGYAHKIGRTLSDGIFDSEWKDWVGDVAVVVQLRPDSSPIFAVHARTLPDVEAENPQFALQIRGSLETLEPMMTREQIITLHLVFQVNHSLPREPELSH